MAVLPTEIFENYSLVTVETVQGIFIPLASIPGLTAAEANETTGDGLELLRALVLEAVSNFNSLPTAPKNVTASLSDTIITETRHKLSANFTFNVTVPQSAYQLLPE